MVRTVLIALVLAASSAACFSLFDISGDDTPPYKPPPPAPTTTCASRGACQAECQSIGGPSCSAWVRDAVAAGQDLGDVALRDALARGCLTDDAYSCYVGAMARVMRLPEGGDLGPALADVERIEVLRGKYTSSHYAWLEMLRAADSAHMCLSGANRILSGPDKGKSEPLSAGARQNACLEMEIGFKTSGFRWADTAPHPIAGVPAIPWSRSREGGTADLALLPPTVDWHCFKVELRQDNVGPNQIRTGDAPTLCEASAPACEARRERLQIPEGTHKKGPCTHHVLSEAWCYTSPTVPYTCGPIPQDCNQLVTITQARGASACVAWAGALR